MTDADSPPIAPAPALSRDAARAALADDTPRWSALRWVGRVVGLYLVFSLVARALAGQSLTEILAAVAPIAGVGLVLAVVAHLVDRGRTRGPEVVVATVVSADAAGRDVALEVTLADGTHGRWLAAADPAWLPAGTAVWCTVVRDGEPVRTVVAIDGEAIVAEPASAARVTVA